MRPLRLHIEGFTSFRQPQDIDFTDLGLFVITGPTGSGKTSILDALTLALYGQIARTNKHQIREMISLGASQAKVQLDFQVDGTSYRVARRVPRDGSQSATVERVEGDEAVPEVEGSGVREANDRLEQIVGLDYASFTKAVLLPQGAFSEFLKGDPKERRNILVRLLDLDRFDAAGALARRKAAELRNAVATWEELLEREYGEDTEEALAEARRTAEENARRAAVVEEALRSAREAGEGLREMERRREALEVCREAIVSLAGRIAETGEAWETLRPRDDLTREALIEAEAATRAAETEQRDARDAKNARVDEIGDEARLARLQSEAEVLATSSRKIDELTDQIATLDARIGEQQEKASALEGARDQLAQAEAAARSALDVAAGAVQTARENLSRAQRVEALLAERDQASKELTGLKERLHELRPLADGATARAQEHEATLRALETEHRAVALRADLAPGDECPVCGQPVHELPPSDPDTEARIATARDALEAAARDADEKRTQVSTLEAHIAVTQRTVTARQEQLDRRGDAPSVADAEAVVESAETAQRTAREAHDGIQASLQSTSTDLADVRQALAADGATRDSAKNARTELAAAVARARSALVEALGDPLPDDPAGVLEARANRLGAASARVREAEDALEKARAAGETAESARREIQATLNRLDQDRSSLRAVLAERRRDIGAAGVEDLPEPPPAPGEDRSLDLRVLGDAAEALRTAAESAERAIQDQVRDALASLRTVATRGGLESPPDSAGAILAALDEEARSAQLDAGRARDEVTAREERLQKKRAMEEETKEKRVLAARYEKVAKELRADHFVAFLLEESFHDLALRASRELMTISDGRYSLAAEEDSFTVVDHANADEKRSVVTLSGGETFLASLALALALSQGIRDIAGGSAASRLEAIFIDEGFGSLDAATLDVVVEALERLQDGDQMVGVITHVPTLSERIPGGIGVEKGVGGSVVVGR